ncbi:transporter substrate-binding domain-containing protein [Pusillimonas sp. CC-YST705]|uniref:Transporter substrate-binding domain-containing protein n=1 Tax=Mesopusillimonas faecipullorum TaxID=2755040 RepID=A0ABS8C9S1_9BURK|nr:transporter substrate-binding domain-containing protein [Mesopusillimonas faecipullorum]MCB5362789.1 transporter substrate-binding domain-containing protein [Mesopusillimonas faecipullorum]
MSQRDPIRVGVLFSKTGEICTIETSQLMGTLFAIEEINESGGINGREIEVVYYDPLSSPGRYRVLAEQLVLRDKVNVIFGCYLSSTRKAVLPIIEKWNRVLFYPTLYEGFECSSNVIYTGAAPNQNSIQLAEYMTSNYGARVYLVGSDYIYPYESNRIMMDLIQQHPSGEKLGERYVPLNATREDFADIIEDIKNKQPDFVFSTVVGNSTQHFYRAYAEAGLSPRNMPIASLTTLEAEVLQMGVDVAAGHVSSAPYFQSVDSATNQRCLANFRGRFGNQVVPNAGWEAAYFQVHIFAKAMALSGSDSIDALMPNLLGMEFDAPQGRVCIDPANNHACLYPRIGVVNDEGQFTIVRQAKRAVHPDPYLVTHSLGDWTLRLGAESDT